jgi:hypothetical protein
MKMLPHFTGALHEQVGPPVSSQTIKFTKNVNKMVSILAVLS